MQKRNDWAVVFDLDGTLTMKKLGALVQLVDRAALTPETHAAQQAIRDRFLDRAKAGTLSTEEEYDWFISTFEAYAKDRLPRASWKKALDPVELRPGVVETMNALWAAGIPVAVISYGCTDFAEHVLGNAGVTVDAIYATRMLHEDDYVVGYDKTTKVVPDNKGEWSRHFADTHGVPHDRIIAIGDSGGDRTLGHLRELRVVIAESEMEAAKLHKLDVMGEVFITETFDPVAEFLKRTIGLSF